jgi:hypothetical protein
LRRRKSISQRHERLEQPLQRREGQRRLRFDSLGTQNPEPRRVAGDFGQQDRLTSTGLTEYDLRATVSGSCLLE